MDKNEAQAAILAMSRYLIVFRKTASEAFEIGWYAIGSRAGIPRLSSGASIRLQKACNLEINTALIRGDGDNPTAG